MSIGTSRTMFQHPPRLIVVVVLNAAELVTPGDGHGTCPHSTCAPNGYVTHLFRRYRANSGAWHPSRFTYLELPGWSGSLTGIARLRCFALLSNGCSCKERFVRLVRLEWLWFRSAGETPATLEPRMRKGHLRWRWPASGDKPLK